MPSPFSLSSIQSAALDELQSLRTQFPDITPLMFQAGEYLVEEGEESEDIFIVLQGAFVVEQALPGPGARVLTLANVSCSVETFAIVGEMAYLGTHMRTASVKAVANTHALCLKPRHLEALMGDCPMLTRVLCQQFVQRLREANQTLRELRTLQGRQGLR